MSLTDCIIRAFCLIDDALGAYVRDHGPIRSRGPRPTLADSEVLTIEVVGTLLGIETDGGATPHEARRDARHVAHDEPLVPAAAYTLGVVLCQTEGLPPLRFSRLITD